MALYFPNGMPILKRQGIFEAAELNQSGTLEITPGKAD